MPSAGGDLRIVYFAPEAPWPTVSGGRFRVEALRRLLGSVGSVRLIVVGDRPPRDVRLRLRAEGGAVLPARREIPLQRGARIFSAALRGRSIPAQRYLSPRRLVKVRALLAREAPDLVVLGDAYLAASFLGLARDHARAVVIDTHDAASLVADRIAKASGRVVEKLAYGLLARNTFAIEAGWFGRADEVWTLSGDDARFYRERHRLANVVVIPTPVPVPAAVAGPAAGRAGVFVGSYAYWPNEDAALRLIAMAPRLRGALDRIVLVGGGPTLRMRKAAKGAAGVTLTGRVDDVGRFLDEAALVLAPLAAGSGVKVKILEAMARGRPVLTTPVGAEGLPIESGVHAEVVDLEQFVEAAAALMADPARRAAIGAAGLRLVREHNSFAAVEAQLRARVMGLMERARTP